MDDYGDEVELEIIIAKGQDEAENFGGRGQLGRPARWLNPPRPCPAPEPPRQFVSDWWPDCDERMPT